MYLKYFFKDTQNEHRHPFKLKTNFTPPIPDNTNLLEYISLVLNDLKTNNNENDNRSRRNISNEQQKSLVALRDNNDLIVKPADKGGAIVIWPRESYLMEAYKLNNNLHYKLITTDPFPQLITDINQFVKTIHNKQFIDYTTFKFLYIDKPTRKPTLYLLPKIHKPDVPGRPIISGCGGPTVRLSEYNDFYLKPLMNNINSYVKDSTDFLKRIFRLNNNIPTNNNILVTIDVKSLYTNIPNEEGISASINLLKEHYASHNINLDVIHDTLELVLNNNSLNSTVNIIYKRTEPLWAHQWHHRTLTYSWRP